MTTLVSMQQVLEALAETRRADTAMEASGTVVPTYASVVSSRKSATGWDPHEVWLDRIKRPRDQRRAN